MLFIIIVSVSSFTISISISISILVVVVVVILLVVVVVLLVVVVVVVVVVVQVVVVARAVARDGREHAGASGAWETMLAERVLANIAVYSRWCTEGLQNYTLVCNGTASDSAGGLLEIAFPTWFLPT